MTIWLRKAHPYLGSRVGLIEKCFVPYIDVEKCGVQSKIILVYVRRRSYQTANACLPTTRRSIGHIFHIIIPRERETDVCLLSVLPSASPGVVSLQSDATKDELQL